MHGAGGVEPLFVVAEGDAERSETDAGGLDIGEDEGGGRREDVGAFAHLVWTTRVHATCAGRSHVIIHGIAAKLANDIATAAESGLFGRATVDLGDANVACEGGFLRIDQKTWIAETGSVAVDGGLDPAESAVIAAAEIESDVPVVVVHIHRPGEVELFVVVDATGTMTLRFGFGQRGQK